MRQGSATSIAGVDASCQYAKTWTTHFPQIHRLIQACCFVKSDWERFLIISKASDVSRRSRTLSGGDEERRLSRMNNTSQGGATEVNDTDDALMADQGFSLQSIHRVIKNIFAFARLRRKPRACPWMNAGQGNPP